MCTCCFCNGRCCFVFSCKKPEPEMPGTICEGISLGLGIILFCLAIPELYAYCVFADVFNYGSAEACCGIISEITFDTPGAVCFEEDFSEDSPIIGKREIGDGIMYCFVDNVKCDVFTTDSGLTSTIEECVYEPTQGYNISNICSTEILAATTDTSMGVFSCVTVFLFGFITASLFFCETWGCFKGTCCENKWYQGTNKLFEITAWCLFLFISKVFIENAALNGYDNAQYAQDNPSFEYFRDDCLDAKNMIWTEYELDVPDWLASDGFDSLGWLGLALSIVDFLLFFIIICGCCCKQWRDDKILPSGKKASDDVTEDQTRTAIEAGNPETNAQTQPVVIQQQVQQGAAPIHNASSPQPVVYQQPQQMVYVNAAGQPIQPQTTAKLQKDP